MANPFVTVKIDYASSLNSGRVAFAGGNTNVDINALGIKADAPIVASLINPTNPVYIQYITVSDDFFTVIFSADPGACEIGYFIANAVT